MVRGNNWRGAGRRRHARAKKQLRLQRPCPAQAVARVGTASACFCQCSISGRTWRGPECPEILVAHHTCGGTCRLWVLRVTISRPDDAGAYLRGGVLIFLLPGRCRHDKKSNLARIIQDEPAYRSHSRWTAVVPWRTLPERFRIDKYGVCGHPKVWPTIQSYGTPTRD